MMQAKKNGSAARLARDSYIEAIHELSGLHGAARTVDLAARLGVRAASVSEAVSRLVADGIAVRRARHEIALTKGGAAVAKGLEERHSALRMFMVECLKMPKKEADETACLVEHFVGGEFVRRLIEFVDTERTRHGAEPKEGK